jgi:chemotaxis protein CheD
MSHDYQIKTPPIVIGIGEYQIGNMPMSTIGLGSCVGLIIHDESNHIGALAHVMLPDSRGRNDHPGKFADTAVAAILTDLNPNGNKLTAKLVGGASLFQNFSSTLNIGQRNIAAIREILTGCNIQITAEEVGGTSGRTMTYYPEERGKVIIKAADGILLEI